MSDIPNKFNLFIIGKTGSGKSTFANGFINKKLIS